MSLFIEQFQPDEHNSYIEYETLEGGDGFDTRYQIRWGEARIPIKPGEWYQINVGDNTLTVYPMGKPDSP